MCWMSFNKYIHLCHPNPRHDIHHRHPRKFSHSPSQPTLSHPIRGSYGFNFFTVVLLVLTPHKWCHIISTTVRKASFTNIMLLRFSHAAACSGGSALHRWVGFHYIDVLQVIYVLSFDDHLCRCHFSAITDKAGVNIRVQAFFFFLRAYVLFSLGWKSRSQMAGT